MFRQSQFHNRREWPKLKSKNADKSSSLRFVGAFRLFPGGTARPEESGPDTNDRCAFFNGDLEVTAHAHAEMGEGSAEELLASFLELAQLSEHRADFFGIGNIRSHGHQAVDFNFFQVVKLQ